MVENDCCTHMNDVVTKLNAFIVLFFIVVLVFCLLAQYLMSHA